MGIWLLIAQIIYKTLRENWSLSVSGEASSVNNHKIEPFLFLCPSVIQYVFLL